MTNAFKGWRGWLTAVVLALFGVAARAVSAGARAWSRVKGRVR